MTKTCFLVPFVLLLSCGGASPDAPPSIGSSGAVSSARLKVLVYASVDGAVIPTTQVCDAARKERCQVLPDAAGTLRCMPFSEAISFYGYLDAACTKPVFFKSKTDCRTPQYGAVGVKVRCDGPAEIYGYDIYAVTPMAEQPMALYRNTSGSCTPTGAIASDLFDYFSGTRVPETEFVDLQLRVLSFNEQLVR